MKVTDKELREQADLSSDDGGHWHRDAQARPNCAGCYAAELLRLRAENRSYRYALRMIATNSMPFGSAQSLAKVALKPAPKQPHSKQKLKGIK